LTKSFRPYHDPGIDLAFGAGVKATGALG